MPTESTQMSEYRITSPSSSLRGPTNRTGAFSLVVMLLGLSSRQFWRAPYDIKIITSILVLNEFHLRIVLKFFLSPHSNFVHLSKVRNGEVLVVPENPGWHWEDKENFPEVWKVPMEQVIIVAYVLIGDRKLGLIQVTNGAKRGSFVFSVVW
jgi:hypothetical protein